MKRKLMAGLLGVVMAMSLVGCGSSASTSTAASSAPAAQEETKEEAAEETKEEAAEEATEEAAAEESGEWASDPNHEKYEIEIYTNMQGGATYVLGVAFADIINQHSEWLTATAMESPGPDQTASMILSDEYYQQHAIGYMIGVDAVLGEEPFSGPNYDLRAMIGYGLVANSFITLDPNLKTLQDLEGKTVALRTKPNVPAADIPEKMFELLGINANLEFMSFADSATALSDGKVDAILSGGMALNSEASEWTRMAALAEVYARNDVYYISMDPDALYAAKDAMNHSLLPGVMTLEAGRYDAEFNEELSIMADYLCWYCHKDFPEDVQLELLNIYYNYADQFAEYKDEGKYCCAELMGMVDTPELLSDVARKFYEEKGIEINDRETPYELYVPK